MAQHFLLSAAARTLSLKEIFKDGEEKAYAKFQLIRWAETKGEPVCPRCGSLKHYDIPSRRRFMCGDCKHQYSVTSGTIFASRKMAFTDLLGAICIFVNAVKGISACQLSRDLDCQYKTAWVLAHKLREALNAEIEGQTLKGEVEIDGAYFGGHIRPANLKENRIDRRLAKHQTGKRRVVVALRQRNGRTLPFVLMSEADGVPLAAKKAEKGTVFYADEASHWDALSLNLDAYRINHSEAYSFNGIHTNNVESYFARLRRMVEGQHHGVSPRYLFQYANEAAWKEDHRRLPNGDAFHRTLGLALHSPKSKAFAGYWQRAQ